MRDLYYTAANSPQPATILARARVRRTKENSPARQRWECVKDLGIPGAGRKSFCRGGSFAPFRGWSIGYGDVSPSGLADLVAALPLCGAGNPARSRLRAARWPCTRPTLAVQSSSYAVRWVSDLSPVMAACAAASRAIGTRYGEHET